MIPLSEQSIILFKRLIRPTPHLVTNFDFILMCAGLGGLGQTRVKGKEVLNNGDFSLLKNSLTCPGLMFSLYPMTP